MRLMARLKTQIGGAVYRLSQQRLLQGVVRGLYQLLWRIFRGALVRQPRVAGLYVKGSFARGDYRPGLSDIDVFIIIEDHLAFPELLALLDFTRRLKDWPVFRPVGEIEVATAAELMFCQSQTGFCYLDQYDWKWEWGVQPLGLFRRKRPQPSELAALYIEVFTYLHHFSLVRVARPPEMGLEQKMLSLLAKLVPGERPQPGLDITGIHRQALLYLDRRVVEVTGGLPFVELPAEASQGLGPFTVRTSFHRLRFRYLDRPPAPAPAPGETVDHKLLVFPELWISETLGSFMHHCWFDPDSAPEPLRVVNQSLFDSIQRQVLLMQWRGYYVNTFGHDPDVFGPRVSLMGMRLAGCRLTGRPCNEADLRRESARAHMRALDQLSRLLQA